MTMTLKALMESKSARSGATRNVIRVLAALLASNAALLIDVVTWYEKQGMFIDSHGLSLDALELALRYKGDELPPQALRRIAALALGTSRQALGASARCAAARLIETMGSAKTLDAEAAASAMGVGGLHTLPW